MTDTTDSYSRFIHHSAKNMASWIGRHVEGRYVCRTQCATHCVRDINIGWLSDSGCAYPRLVQSRASKFRATEDDSGSRKRLIPSTSTACFFILRSRSLSLAYEDQLERFYGRRTRAIWFRTVVYTLPRDQYLAGISCKYSSASSSLHNITFISR